MWWEHQTGVKAQICPKPLSNGISYQRSTSHLHIRSLTRCPQQRKNSFSFSTANGSHFLMILSNGKRQRNIIPPHVQLASLSISWIPNQSCWNEKKNAKAIWEECREGGMAGEEIKDRAMCDLHQKHTIRPLLQEICCIHGKCCKVLWGAMHTFFS